MCIAEMNEITKRKILIEYYETVSGVLQFELNKESRDLSEKILKLLLDIFGEADGDNEILQSVGTAECLQTASDAVLMIADGVQSEEPAFAIKAELIRGLGIEKLKCFDLPMLYIQTERAALGGEKYSYKLLAAMKWLGIGTPKDQATALEMWKTLAVNGDDAAVFAVIYACGALGNIDEKEKWEKAQAALLEAEWAFLPMVLDKSDDNGAELANLILAIKGKGKQNGKAGIDRAMAHYILYADDSFEDKLKVVSSETNFYPILWKSHKYEGKKFGF